MSWVTYPSYPHSPWAHTLPASLAFSASHQVLKKWFTKFSQVTRFYEIMKEKWSLWLKSGWGRHSLLLITVQGNANEERLHKEFWHLNEDLWRTSTAKKKWSHKKWSHKKGFMTSLLKNNSKDSSFIIILTTELWIYFSLSCILITLPIPHIPFLRLTNRSDTSSAAPKS